MRVQFSKGKARARWAEICRAANEAMPEQTFTRTMPDGNVQTYTRRRKAISDGAQQTGYSLIMYYASHYRSITKAMLDVPHDLADTDTLPSLRTNGELLARYRESITSRTSRTHIKQLMALGLIVEKKFHGTKANFELFFNEGILFGTDSVIFTEKPVFSAPDSTFSAAENADFENTKGINFPLIHTLETNRNITTTISNVENSTKWQHSVENSTKIETMNGNTTSANPPQKPQNDGNGGLAAAGRHIYSVWSKNVDNSPKNVDNYVDKPNFTASDFDRQPRDIQNRIVSFWKYAKMKLYFDKNDLTEYEYLKTVELITDGIYRPFADERPNAAQWEEFQRELLASIDVAARYYESNPGKYPGKPYSVSGGYLGYFDAANPRGFKVATAWRFQNKAKQHEQYGTKVMNLGIMHLQKKASGLSHQLPKLLRNKTFSELYKHYKAKMLKYNTETQKLFVDRFNQIAFN